MKLSFTLPDANAPEVLRLVHDWDDDQFERLSPAERRRIVDRLAALHRARALPTIEGEETLDLVKQDAGWRVVLNWAGGVHVRFGATVDRSVPLEVTVTPAEVVINPGERVRVTVRARNRTAHELTTRVGHRIEPAAQSQHLALVQCPLFVPITLAAGETREFTSVYDQGWIGCPEEIVDALAHEGYQEYKREETRSRRGREPTGGVWQGLNAENGSVESAIWVNRAPGDDAIVFIDIDGEPLTGRERGDA